MKKLINDPTAVVDESLAGLRAGARRPRDRPSGPDYVVRADAPVAGKVGLVSGGGSGHEPLHGGFVGTGHAGRRRARAPCSPRRRPDQILAATQAVDGGAGVLHIVKNYTGDVLNFETAAELAAGRGHRGPRGRDRRRRRRQGLACTRPAAAASAAPCWSRRSPARPPSAATTSTRSPRSPSGSTRNVRIDGRGADRRAPCRTPGEPSFDARRGRDRDRHRHPRRAGPATDQAGARRRASSTACWTPIVERPAVRIRRQGAAVRQRHGRHAR